MKALVLKLSSALVMQEERTPWLSEFASVVSKLQAEYRVCVVVSGAVALGRQAYGQTVPETHQLLGILGQPLLFNAYSEALKQRGIAAAQLLISKDDFRSRHHYLKIREALHELLSSQVVPLINENDTVRLGGRSFSDNDEIARLLASLLDAERLVIASSVEGLLDETGKLVPQVNFGSTVWRPVIKKERSLHGRGGMELKCLAAQHLARRGISTTICSGFDPRVILAAALGQKVGTKFVADKHLSAKKRWLLDHAPFARGMAHIDKKAAEIMKSTEASSLLLVGVTRLEGNFEQGDVISIVDPDGQIIGYGQARFSATEAVKLLDKQAKHILVHYDQYIGAV